MVSLFLGYPAVMKLWEITKRLKITLRRGETYHSVVLEKKSSRVTLFAGDCKIWPRLDCSSSEGYAPLAVRLNPLRCRHWGAGAAARRQSSQPHLLKLRSAKGRQVLYAVATKTGKCSSVQNNCYCPPADSQNGLWEIVQGLQWLYFTGQDRSHQEKGNWDYRQKGIVSLLMEDEEETGDYNFPKARMPVKAC